MRWAFVPSRWLKLAAFARCAAVVRTVVDGIVIIDVQGVVRESNPAAEHLFGYVAEAVVG